MVAMWTSRVEYEGMMAVAEALRNTAPAMKDRALTGPENYTQLPELAARGQKRLGVFFDTVEKRLAGRDFLATDAFSVADIAALVTVDFARVVRCKPAPEQVNIARWRAAFAERPSATA